MTAAPPPSSSDRPAMWKFDYLIYHAETGPSGERGSRPTTTPHPGVWLCSWKPATGKPACPYPRGGRGGDLLRLDRSTADTLDDDPLPLSLFGPPGDRIPECRLGDTADEGQLA